jgi:hypothetical protein
MLKSEEGKTEANQAAPLLTQTPSATNNTAGLGALKSAWSSSLIIKIIAIAVGGLFLLFFILMIVFASKSTCTTYKDQVTNKDKEIAKLNTTLKTLNGQVAECQGNLGTCQKREQACDSDLRTCNNEKKITTKSSKSRNKLLCLFSPKSETNIFRKKTRQNAMLTSILATITYPPSRSRLPTSTSKYEIRTRKSTL